MSFVPCAVANPAPSQAPTGTCAGQQRPLSPAQPFTPEAPNPSLHISPKDATSAPEAAVTQPHVSQIQGPVDVMGDRRWLRWGQS